MLKITLPQIELFEEGPIDDKIKQLKQKEVKIEHSLLSISTYESKIKKSFLSFPPKNGKELLIYIPCMVIGDELSKIDMARFDSRILSEILDYIQDPMTATTINSLDQKIDNRIITSELIYSWMIELNIPFETQKWHLNRLLTLIRVCNIRAGKQKKMSKAEVFAQNKVVNEMRKQKMNSGG
jgi:hypothetical protein